MSCFNCHFFGDTAFVEISRGSKNSAYYSLSEVHFKSTKTSRGYYSDLEQSSLVKILEFYLVTQSF
jgi:hypothetical protein